MPARKPIIGIIGGVGSGKSFVARLFGELGCLVIDSDEQVRQAYLTAEVRDTLRGWWGSGVFKPDGAVDRKAIAGRVFENEQERLRLEGLLHPIVARMRDQAMARVADDPAVVAYVWDTPLLVETGLNARCDAVVFVEADEQTRKERVLRTRGWTENEWRRREKLQTALDKKRSIANDIIRNTAGADDEVRDQVREVLSRILAKTTDRPATGP